MLSEKIKEMQRVSLERGYNPPKTSIAYEFNKAVLGRYKDLEKWEKGARAMADAIAAQDVFVYPDDNIVGRFYVTNVVEEEEVSDDFEYEVDSIDLRNALSEIIFNEYFKKFKDLNSYKKLILNAISRFIFDREIEEELIEQYEDELKDYFEEEAMNDCNND